MTTKTNQSIPESITSSFLRNWVEPRVSEKRFRHIEGVVKQAKLFAKHHNCNIEKAEIAAWLHDSYKESKQEHLVQLAIQYGMQLTDFERANAHLLHGPVAAYASKYELNINDQEIFCAIAEHTLGAAPMCALSEVLYLADCLEESRSPEYTEPIWQALKLNEKADFNKAILVASELGIRHLLDSGRPIHPKAIEVRNCYLTRTKEN